MSPRSTKSSSSRDLLSHLPAVVVLAVLSACGGGGESTSPAPQADPPSPAAAAPPPVAMAPPHGGGGAGERALDATGVTVTTPTVAFDLPARWRRESPSSSMRLAQASIPGEVGPAELAVFHFGAGQGGTVDANFERWSAQMEPPAGVEPERGAIEAGPYRISWMELPGTFKAGGMGGPTVDQPGFRLLGAVVEGEGGPWFFKVTGPDSTVAGAREELLGMLRGVRPPAAAG